MTLKAQAALRDQGARCRCHGPRLVMARWTTRRMALHRTTTSPVEVFAATVCMTCEELVTFTPTVKEKNAP